jgi:hypothetical protein
MLHWDVPRNACLRPEAKWSLMTRLLGRRPNTDAMKRLFPILLLLLSLSGLAFASDWKQEVNGRWGFSLTYPGSLTPEPLPTNGAGRRYHSADHEVSLVAMGSLPGGDWVAVDQ